MSDQCFYIDMTEFALVRRHMLICPESVKKDKSATATLEIVLKGVGRFQRDQFAGPPESVNVHLTVQADYSEDRYVSVAFEADELLITINTERDDVRDVTALAANIDGFSVHFDGFGTWPDAISANFVEFYAQ
jgi:hypothetical protein